MRGWARVLTISTVMAAASSILSAHYHWTYFPNRNGPFLGVPARFDLNVLANKTVYYFLSDDGPGPLMPGDSYAGIVSQIRAAADTWDSVAASDLRLKFGGYSSAPAPQTTPGIDVVFDDDIPPGVIARTYVTRPDDVSFVAFNAAQVPILRSRIQFRRDLTNPQQPTYADQFFTTLVHEFGHSLGLQHTLTSSAMTTYRTRGTTRARPLTADDVAGIASLYPTPAFLSETGSVAGRVTLGSTGVNLASVVAVSITGVAVSGMSNPDGTYRIDGVPPGDYYVYVHPLPPAQASEATPGDIVWPVDPQNIPFAANTGFVTQFFPGTRDWTQAATIPVAAGNISQNINFGVQGSAGPALANMQTYGFQGANQQVAVPAPSLQAGRRAYLAFYADGAIVNGQLAPGLNVRVLGSGAFVEPGSTQIHPTSPNYVLTIVNVPAAINGAPVTSAIPATLAVNVNSDLYVLPAAFVVVPAPAPVVVAVDGVSDNLGGATVTVSGSNLNAQTRVMFDGAPGKITEAKADGSLTVIAPPASGLYRAPVVALNADGQTSAQALGTTAPPVFTYTAPDNPVISVNPAFVAAGTDSMIEIDGFSTDFMDGQVAVGIGTSDVLVRKIWVLDRNRLLMNISVSAGAATGSVPVTVASGLQLMTVKTILQIQPYNSRAVSMRAPALNQDTGLAGVQPGHIALVSTMNFPSNLSGWIFTVSNQPVNPLVGGGNQLYVPVPPGLPVGPAILRAVSPTGEYVAPIVMQVDGPPPSVLSVTLAGQSVDPARTYHAGDVITVTVSGLADPDGTVPAASAVRVKVAGVDHTAASVTDLGGIYAVQFTLSSLVPFGPQQSLSMGVGTRFSNAVTVGIRN